jgi:hypothetical protein
MRLYQDLAGGRMGIQFTAVRPMEVRSFAGPVHRSILAVDLEGSTKRTNPERGELRRILYSLLDQALHKAGINPRHLEPLVDRGDGVLVLIRPHDEVPKTVLLGVLIPALTALLDEHNATVTQPTLRLRLRAVIHSGEVHDDGRGFYGEDLDLAFRLLDAPKVKRALREAPASPLVLVVSEEIFAGIVRHRYFDGGTYEPLVRLRLAERQHRGWIHIPDLPEPDRPAPIRRAKGQLPISSLGVVSVDARRQDQQESSVSALTVNGRAGPPRGRG